MTMDNLVDLKSMIITLDVDALIVSKLQLLTKAGYTMVELNSVDPRFLAKIMDDFPMLTVGAGNVTNTQQLEHCYKAGLDFVTSPGFVPELVQTAQVYSINYLPGVATLSEALQASTLGCQQVRPFPAILSFCTLLNKYLPQLKLYPAEVEWEETEHIFEFTFCGGRKHT